MPIKELAKRITYKMFALQIAFITCLLMTGVSLPSMAEDMTAGNEAAGADQAVKDAWIQGKLEGVYLFNEHLSPFAIDTNVRDGVVQLAGTVESEIDKELAEEIARGIDGVREVNNRLMVDAGSQKDREKATADRDRSEGGNGAEAREVESENKFVRWVVDATITAAVKSKLLAEENISGMDIDVSTQNNRVTLSGEVESDEVRQLAEKIAENTEDVVEVENNLRVSGRVADIE